MQFTACGQSIQLNLFNVPCCVFSLNATCTAPDLSASSRQPQSKLPGVMVDVPEMPNSHQRRRRLVSQVTSWQPLHTAGLVGSIGECPALC